ncbi:hypothetical protein [Haloprofundus salinisoli]|uniref:hypothetical protein n=1 Tax=Haloprofundus salinisoli TaxID=2876193 RepID=UPI001CCACA9D|nr:hypothetical protein [Haloprofundus salinisoli]
MGDFTLLEIHLHDGFSFSPTNTGPMFAGKEGDADEQSEAIDTKGTVSKLLGKRGRATGDGGTSDGVDQIETAADVESRERKARGETTSEATEDADEDASDSGGNGGKLLLALVLVAVIAAAAKSLMGDDAGFDELEELDELSGEA